MRLTADITRVLVDDDRARRYGRRGEIYHNLSAVAPGCLLSSPQVESPTVKQKIESLCSPGRTSKFSSAAFKEGDHSAPPREEELRLTYIFGTKRRETVTSPGDRTMAHLRRIGSASRIYSRNGGGLWFVSRRCTKEINKMEKVNQSGIEKVA